MQFEYAELSQDIVSYLKTICENNYEKHFGTLNELTSESKSAEFVTCLLQNVNVLFTQEAKYEYDIEGLFRVLILMLEKFDNVNKEFQLQLLNQLLSVHSTEQEGFVLKLSMQLFDTMDDRYRVDGYIAIVEYIQKSDALYTSAMEDTLMQYEKYFRVPLNAKESQRISETIILKMDIQQDKPQRKVAYLKYICTYLQSFVDAKKNQQECATYQEKVTEIAMVLGVQIPILSIGNCIDLMQFDVFQGNTTALHPLFQLLWSKSSSAKELKDVDDKVFVKYNLDKDECATKLKLLSLCKYAPCTPESVSYEHVAQTLEVKVDEVEMWIVKAMTVNVVECRIDQLNKQIHFTRSLARGTFGMEQYQNMLSRLQSWKVSMNQALANVQDKKKTLMAVDNPLADLQLE